MPPTADPWITGLAFPESPRWHRGVFWFSDMHDHAVFAVRAGDRLERMAAVPGCPSGLGFPPDGGFVVVSMRDRRVLHITARGVERIADLSAICPHPINDLAMDPHGRAYVGGYGYDADDPNAAPRTSSLMLITPDGRVTLAAADLGFPNGIAFTSDGRTLLVAETDAQRVSCFDVQDRGALGERSVFAELPGCAPDGICPDADGGVWVADALRNHCLRVVEGGRITDRVETTQSCFACCLGGADGRTLFLTTAPTWRPAEAVAERRGAIERARVEIPGPVWSG